MKNSFLLILVLVLSACQSTLIKNDRYKVSTTKTELGSIGQSKSLFNLQNDFNTRALPTLENKIRVSVELIPFNKKLNKFYSDKAKYNQNQPILTYIDSLSSKPELVTIQILDVAGLVNELNSENNTNTFRLLQDTQNSQIISSIAVYLPTEDMAKIRFADSYYLTNYQEAKYALSLYKQGKKTETIDINSGTVVAYQLSSFCWSFNNRGKWYIADITENCSSCKGKTKSRITENKKATKIFKM